MRSLYILIYKDFIMFVFYLIGCVVAFIYAVLWFLELKKFDIKLYVLFVFVSTLLSWSIFILITVIYVIMSLIDQLMRDEESGEYYDYDED